MSGGARAGAVDEPSDTPSVGHGPRRRTLELGAPVLLDAGALTLEAPGGAR